MAKNQLNVREQIFEGLKLAALVFVIAFIVMITYLLLITWMFGGYPYAAEYVANTILALILIGGPLFVIARSIKNRNYIVIISFIISFLIISFPYWYFGTL